MRKLNITKCVKGVPERLKDIPEELLWIEKIALEFALTKKDLKKLYKCGLKAYEKFIEKKGKERLKEFVVRQAMLNLLNDAK